MLLVQGFQSWFLRKAIGLATITLSITHKPDELGVERVEVVNSLTGGITTTELSVLDWTSRLHEDHFFGEVLGKSKRVDSPNTIEDSFLKEDWDTSDGVLLFYDESVRESKRWTSEQVRECALLWNFYRVAQPPFPPEGLGVCRAGWRAQARPAHPYDGSGHEGALFPAGL